MLSEAGRPETEVTEKSKRRRFSAEFKRKIVKEAAGCTEAGELGALLRREGLYSSHLTQWRRQFEQGSLEPRKRGPKAKPVDPRDRKIAQLERDNAKLAARAERAETLVEVQKKLSKILGIAMPGDDESKP